MSNIKLKIEKVKSVMETEHGYDMDSEFWTDDLIVMMEEITQACETLANEQLKAEKATLSQDIGRSALLVHGTDGRLYKPNSIEEWEDSDNGQKGDVMYTAKVIKRY